MLIQPETVQVPTHSTRLCTTFALQDAAHNSNDGDDYEDGNNDNNDYIPPQRMTSNLHVCKLAMLHSLCTTFALQDALNDAADDEDHNNDMMQLIMMSTSTCMFALAMLHSLSTTFALQDALNVAAAHEDHNNDSDAADYDDSDDDYLSDPSPYQRRGVCMCPLECEGVWKECEVSGKTT